MHHTHILYVFNDELKVALHASAYTHSMTAGQILPLEANPHRGSTTVMSAACWQKDMNAGRQNKQACVASNQPAHLGRGVVIATHALKVHA